MATLGLLASATASLALLVAVAHGMGGTTWVVSPTGDMTSPCTTGSPCNFQYALANAAAGDTVMFEAGTYDFNNGGGNADIPVTGGLTLEGIPGATLPIIKQTVAYSSCNCPIFSMNAGTSGHPTVIRDLEIDQTVGGAGAIFEPDYSIVERTILVGENGMYFGSGTNVAAAEPILRDSLIVGNTDSSGGDGVWSVNAGGTINLEGDTVIGAGTNGIAIYAEDNGNAITFNVTNTIAHGSMYDVEAFKDSMPANVTLNYSDVSTEHAVGGATITSTNHDITGTPLFASSSDYHEASNSPTIGTGTTSGLTGSNALDDLPRLTGSSTDIGAYEYQGLATPTATPSVSSTTTGTAVMFTAGDSDPNPGAGTLTYTWSFDDGGSASGASVSHTFATAGFHTASVTVGDGSPYTASNSTSVTVTNATSTGPTSTAPAIGSPDLVLHQPKPAKGKTKAKPFRAKLSFTLNEAATVDGKILLLLKGKRIDGHCEAGLVRAREASKKLRPCPKTTPFGAFTVAGTTGDDSVTLPGSAIAKHFKAGSYRLTLTSEADGLSSQPTVLTFRVV